MAFSAFGAFCAFSVFCAFFLRAKSFRKKNKESKITLITLFILLLKIHWALQLFGNKVIERLLLTGQAEHPNSFIHILI